VNRGTRAVLYFFFASVSLLLGSIAIYSGGPLAAIGGAADQPWLEVYGWLVVVVAFAAPVLFAAAALYALLFGHDD
jgi:hypothetical protein